MAANSEYGAGKEYDVAISFLVADEKIAAAVKASLTGLRVFFYPHNQEALIATNGMESMRRPFLDAKVLVVVYREPWGQTPWTGVESDAIMDRCLKERFRPLVFLQLHKDGELPEWLPTTHIRCVLDDFGIEQLAGAIKVRVQELGGIIKPLDARSEARRVKLETEYLQDRHAKLTDQSWIQKIVGPAIAETLEHVVHLADQIREEDGLDIRAVAHQRECVIRAERSFACVSVNWYQRFINTLIDEHARTGWRIFEVAGGLPFPGTREMSFSEPKKLAEHYFKADVAIDRSLVWVEDGKQEHFTSARLAERIVNIYIDLLSRCNQGTVKPPDW